MPDVPAGPGRPVACGRIGRRSARSFSGRASSVSTAANRNPTRDRGPDHHRATGRSGRLRAETPQAADRRAPARTVSPRTLRAGREGSQGEVARPTPAAASRPGTSRTCSDGCPVGRGRPRQVVTRTTAAAVPAPRGRSSRASTNSDVRRRRVVPAGLVRRRPRSHGREKHDDRGRANAASTSSPAAHQRPRPEDGQPEQSEDAGRSRRVGREAGRQTALGRKESRRSGPAVRLLAGQGVEQEVRRAVASDEEQFPPGEHDGRDATATAAAASRRFISPYQRDDGGDEQGRVLRLHRQPGEQPGRGRRVATGSVGRRPPARTAATAASPSARPGCRASG